MGLVELLFLAIGLSMDAFAVSICKGLALPKLKIKHCLICGAWFGIFQAGMPLIGYFLGSRFERIIRNIAPWIAFVLLAAIGANMIREAFSKNEDKEEADMGFKSMFLLAVATSIDALAVGVTFACVPVHVISTSVLLNTIFAVCVIGIITFIISAAGVKIGNVFGTKYKSGAEITGGVILILIGLKIILEYFGVINLGF